MKRLNLSEQLKVGIKNRTFVFYILKSDLKYLKQKMYFYSQ